MVTTVTQMMLKRGGEKAWDAVMQERLDAAKKRNGWLEGQVLMPMDGKTPRRIVVGSWKSRHDWEAWHRDPVVKSTRARIDSLESEPPRQWWHEVTVSAQR